MRLIDADDVVDSLKNWFIMHRYYHPYSKSNLIPTTEVIDIIDRSPTIEERKTGKWECTTSRLGDIVFYHFKCPECGHENGGRCSNYCPSCGARMVSVDD